jgi:hypothetical protein
MRIKQGICNKSATTGTVLLFFFFSFGTRLDVTATDANSNAIARVTLNAKKKLVQFLYWPGHVYFSLTTPSKVLNQPV